MDEEINVDEYVSNFTEGQFMVCAHRAALALNYDVELNPDGGISTFGLAQAVVAHGEQEEYRQAFDKQLVLMAAEVQRSELVAAGLIYADGVDDEGNIMYRAVPDADA